MLIRSLLRAIVFMGFAALAAAQQRPATVTGMVTYRGNRTPNVAIQITNVDTLQKFSGTTDEDGKFHFASVPKGKYDVLLKPQGLQKLGTLRTRLEIDSTTEEPRFRLEDLYSTSGRSPASSGSAKSGSITLPSTAPPAPPPLAPSPPPTAAKGAPRLTGRSFLIGTEAAGYGLYSYILFASPANGATAERYNSTLAAFLRVINEIEGLETAGNPRQELNITYLPLKSPPPANPPVAVLFDSYNYAAAQTMLKKLPGALHTGGPYIVSTLLPLSSYPNAPNHHLYQDLSAVPPVLIEAWLRQFMLQASTETFWDEPKLSSFALNLRTNIEVAASALTVTKQSMEELKTLKTSLASLIIWK